NSCAGIKCGSSASCTFYRDGSPYCLCDDGTSNFNETDKTCYNACAKKDCGPNADCVHMAPVPNSPAECMCHDGTTYNETDKTCYDPCALSGKDCGSDATCFPSGSDAVCECNMGGFLFNEPDKTCFDPLVQTAVQLSGHNFKERLTFSTSVPAKQASGTTVCSDLSSRIGNAKITVTWDAPKARVGNGMCKSLTFYAGRGCTGQQGLTIARPAKKGRAYPATKRPIKAAYSLPSHSHPSRACKPRGSAVVTSTSDVARYSATRELGRERRRKLSAVSAFSRLPFSPAAVSSPFVMERLTGLGLAALVAGLVAISFLATHASAADSCDKDCGPDAGCVLRAPNSPAECMCYGGTTFNETDKTCYDPCVLLGKECGPDAICYPRGPDAVCSCYMNGFTFNETDKTCFPPLVRTVVELSGRNTKKLEFTFSTSVPAEQASGTTVCSNFSSSSGDSKITVVWDAPLAFDPLSLNACVDYFFLLPTTATCHKDCGTAECVVKEGKQQCQCPEGLVFNAAKKLCRAAPPPKCNPACTGSAQCTWVGGKSVCRA
ncbi:unnamed protein product, partial [Closterium sp. Naga37s-1]